MVTLNKETKAGIVEVLTNKPEGFHSIHIHGALRDGLFWMMPLILPDHVDINPQQGNHIEEEVPDGAMD